MCPKARNMLDMAMSQEVALTTITAYNIFKHSAPSGSETFFNEELQVAKVRYAHALRRLKEAYPGRWRVLRILGPVLHGDHGLDCVTVLNGSPGPSSSGSS